MYKYLLFLLLFGVHALGQVITFTEEKYIDVLQTTVSKKGVISLKDDHIMLSYEHQNKYYLFFENHVIIKNSTTEEKYDYESKPNLHLFYRVIHFIFTQKKEQIEHFFYIEQDVKKTVLTPRVSFLNFIEKIEFEKAVHQLKFLQLFFTNKDYIKIVQD